MVAKNYSGSCSTVTDTAGFPLGPLYRDLLKREYQHLRPRIVGCVEITNYQQIPEVMEKIGQFDFDLALVSAGTSAVILVPRSPNDTAKWRWTSAM